MLAAMGLWRAAVFAHPVTHLSQSSVPSVALYDSYPSHLWNHLYATLFMRQDRQGDLYGEDSLDPLYWTETEHQLAEPSHQRAMDVLDEFLRTHAETLVHDPVKKAMLQRDLWALFDWTVVQYSANGRPHYEKEKRELQIRLAEVLQRLALTPEEIKSLPDTYAQAVASGAFAKEYDPANRERAFLPPDLLAPHSPWVCIQPSPDSDAGVAKMHIFNLSGRSSFLVFVRLPGGHKATMDYLQSLWNFPQPWIPGQSPGSDQAVENPALPPFPAGTEFALVRHANVFDSEGEIEASPITESVQIRVYRSITTAEPRNFTGGIDYMIRESGQDFFEIKMSRSLLFAGKNGGLRAVGRTEKEFFTFQSQGDDQITELADRGDFERNRIPEVQTCIWCHSGGGVSSFNSRSSLFRPNRRQQDPDNPQYGPVYWGDFATIAWKQNRYDWGLLNGYWKASKPQQTPNRHASVMRQIGVGDDPDVCTCRGPNPVERAIRRTDADAACISLLLSREIRGGMPSSVPARAESRAGR